MSKPTHFTFGIHQLKMQLHNPRVQVIEQSLFCLPNRKICWTMSVDIVGLKKCPLGTLNSIITLTFFP